jgi:hypothetical protein
MMLAGLAIMIVSEAATLAGIEPFASWNTPICWTGFILFADAIVYRARGNSWLRSSPREFAALALASIPLWVVFEGYNLVIRNWIYAGLPENPALRLFGYAWSFATIWPAIFEGAELASLARQRAGKAGKAGKAGREMPSLLPFLPFLPFLPCPSPLARSCSRHRSWCRQQLRATWRRPAFPRLHLSAGPNQQATRRGSADARAHDQLAAQRPALRRAVGVLELLVACEMDLHRSDHAAMEGLRDAVARLPRLSAVRRRMLHDVRLPARSICLFDL